MRRVGAASTRLPSNQRLSVQNTNGLFFVFLGTCRHVARSHIVQDACTMPPFAWRLVALMTLVVVLQDTIVGAFVVSPTLSRAALPRLSRETICRRISVCASASDDSISRRDVLAKVALGGAGLVLGKKFFEGGAWTGTPDLTGRTVLVTGAWSLFS